MKEKVKTAVDGNGTVGRLLGSKKKKAAAAGILAAVVIALAAAILLNTNKDGEYVVLFPGISREERSWSRREEKCRRRSDGSGEPGR